MQKIVLKNNPYVDTTVHPNSIEWLFQNGYETIAKSLKENPHKLPKRDHEGIVKLVEEKENDLNLTKTGSLTIVEIPEDVEWEISSELNREFVKEKSRKWYPKVKT